MDSQRLKDESVRQKWACDKFFAVMVAHGKSAPKYVEYERVNATEVRSMQDLGTLHFCASHNQTPVDIGIVRDRIGCSIVNTMDHEPLLGELDLLFWLRPR